MSNKTFVEIVNELLRDVDILKSVHPRVFPLDFTTDANGDRLYPGEVEIVGATKWSPPELTETDRANMIKDDPKIPKWDGRDLTPRVIDHECEKCHRKWGTKISTPLVCPFCLDAAKKARVPAGFEPCMTGSTEHIQDLQDQIEILTNELKKEQRRNEQLDVEITALRGKLDRMSKIEAGSNICSECRKPCRPGQLMCAPCKKKVLDDEWREDPTSYTCSSCKIQLGMGEQDELLCPHCRARADVTLEQYEPEERTTDPVCQKCGDPVHSGGILCFTCVLAGGPR